MTLQLKKLWSVYRFVKISFGFDKFETKRKRRFQTFFCSILGICSFLLVLTLYYGYFTSETSSAKIQTRIISAGMTLAFICIPIFVAKREQVTIGLRWCENLQAKYGWMSYFEESKVKSSKTFKVFVYGIPGGSVSLLTIQSIYNACNGIRLAPFGTPTPNIGIFVGICLVQCIGVYWHSLTFGMNWSFIVVMQSHFVAAFDHVKTILSQLRPKMSEKDFNAVIKESVDLHCNIIEYQVLLEHFTYYPVLIIEWIIYLLLLISWIAIFHFRDGFFVAFGTALHAVVYFAVCWTNENLDDVYDDVKNSLYDLEWYEMPPKQRKIIQMVMVALQKRRFVRAGPFHVLTYESFADMLNRVYSYGLIINNVVQLGI